MVCLLKRSPGESHAHSNRDFIPCYAAQCNRCGWNAAEHERRINTELVTGPDGLRHFLVIKPKGVEGK